MTVRNREHRLIPPTDHLLQVTQDGLELSLEVKFDPTVIALFKETRNLVVYVRDWIDRTSDPLGDLRKAGDNVFVRALRRSWLCVGGRGDRARENNILLQAKRMEGLRVDSAECVCVANDRTFIRWR